MSVSMHSTTSSHYTERQEPLVVATTGLNDRLLAQHTDVPDDDSSCSANLVRVICRFVASILTPRQVLGIIRVLKAITFCFLVLNILSNLMYLLFVHLAANWQVRQMAGGARDTLIRIYGIVLCLIALAVEIDVTKVVKKFSGLKGFIARALFMFLIAAITSSKPIYSKEMFTRVINDDYVPNDDGDENAEDDKDEDGDDAKDDDGGMYSYLAYDPTSSIPSSAVNFQMVTASVL